MATESRSTRVCPECGQTSDTGVCPEHQRVLLPPNRRARLASAPLLGYVLDDRYVLVDRIGGGGMSVVYAALQRPLGRLVAVKVLHAQLTATKGARDCFEREARTVSLLKCRNTVTLFDFGVSKAGAMPSVAYMVMEYVAGESLAARLKRVGALPPPDVARIVRDMGRSLHEAHQKGIVHRDMKPANVILTTVGDEEDEGGAKELAKVIDFGIARLEDTAMTQTGILLGTPNYMAPELFEGGREVDARADVYALGVMTFQMLAGYKPFKEEGGPLGVLWHHANSPVPPLPGSDTDPRLRAIEPVIRKAMGKKPEDRYPTVRSMVEALLAAMGATESRLGEEDVIELSIDDIEINPEVRHLTSQYRLDVIDADGAMTALGSADTSPGEAQRPERPTTRRPGAALEERATTPRRLDAPPPRPRAEARSEPRAETRPETRPEPRPPARPEARPEPRHDARPEINTEVRAEPTDRSRALLLPPGGRAEPRPEPRPEPLRREPSPPEPRGGLGPPPPGRSGPVLGALDEPAPGRLEASFDTFGEASGQVGRRRESHGFRGLLIVGALFLLGGGGVLFYLDRQSASGNGSDRPAPESADGPATGAPEAPPSEATAPETVSPESAAPEAPASAVAIAPETARPAPETAAPETAAPVTAAPESLARIDAPTTEPPEAPPTEAPAAPRSAAPRTSARPEAPRGEGKVEAKAAAVRAAIDAGECVQARRLFRELDELPGSTAAVSGLSPALASCRAGAAPPPAEVKAVVVAPNPEDAPPTAAPPPADSRRPARIVAGAPRVQGGLAAGDVQAALRRMLSSAPLGCIGKHPLELAGPAEMTVGLRVTAAGQLIDAALASSSIGNPAFERCVVNSLRALEFPASADASRIDLPLKVVPGQ